MGVDVLGMARAAARDDEFAAVYSAHHRGAVRLAYLLTGDADQAEDIVADAFTKVWRRWHTGDVRDVGPYIRRAVANEANSKLRRRYLERREAARRSGDDRGVRRVDDHAAERDEVWHAIQELPVKQRQAVVLRYYEDLSEAEMAEVLGTAPGTVKSNLSRGLSKLEELLGAGAAQRGGDR